MQNPESKLSQSLSGIQYGYGLNLDVYTKSVDNTIIKSDMKELMTEMITEFFGTAAFSDMMSSMTNSNPLMSMASSSMSTWQEILPGRNGETVNPLIYSLPGAEFQHRGRNRLALG